MQINIGHLDENGVYNRSFTTFALSGQVRKWVSVARRPPPLRLQKLAAAAGAAPVATTAANAARSGSVWGAGWVSSVANKHGVQRAAAARVRMAQLGGAL